MKIPSLVRIEAEISTFSEQGHVADDSWNAGNKIVSLHVKDPIATNNIGIVFFTKDNGSNAPVLTVVTK
ncbi:hypothetical protein [Paenibacillus sp. LPE1-1-1.1]|uniref:hypothetical protein n=1 Tax=Paenibacillus sp. LPE1-1-1.1 TaxID=3135230 RepID=UPI0034318F18